MKLQIAGLIHKFCMVSFMRFHMSIYIMHENLSWALNLEFIAAKWKLKTVSILQISSTADNTEQRIIRHFLRDIVFMSIVLVTMWMTGILTEVGFQWAGPHISWPCPARRCWTCGRGWPIPECSHSMSENTKKKGIDTSTLIDNVNVWELFFLNLILFYAVCWYSNIDITIFIHEAIDSQTVNDNQHMHVVTVHFI